MDKYWILDYNDNRLLGPFTSKEICVTLRLITQLKVQSFDILEEGPLKKIIVTSDFVEEKGRWTYSPQGEFSAAPEMNIEGLRSL